MKKVYVLDDNNKKIDRQLDAIKYEVKKYIARERRKKLGDDFDYWDFDCRVGLSAESAEVVHLAEVNKKIGELEVNSGDSFYLEILAKQAKRTKK